MQHRAFAAITRRATARADAVLVNKISDVCILPERRQDDSMTARPLCCDGHNFAAIKTVHFSLPRLTSVFTAAHPNCEWPGVSSLLQDTMAGLNAQCGGLYY
mmetsp:Transcript_35809/g.59350  ORF Transcript_35809/g.59350 Transcript_35809/m.59350 type:complete len:102 (-) Transcript_35809:254-559(-)